MRGKAFQRPVPWEDLPIISQTCLTEMNTFNLGHDVLLTAVGNVPCSYFRSWLGFDRDYRNKPKPPEHE